MKSTVAGEIALVVMGLYALIGAVSMLSGISGFAYSGPESLSAKALLVAAYVVPSALLLALATHLLRNARAIAQRNFADEVPGPSLDADRFKRILLVALGILLIVNSIPAILTFVFGLIGVFTWDFDPATKSSMVVEHVSHHFGVIVQVAIAIVLVKRPEFFSRFFKDSNTPGLVDSASELQCPACGHPYSLADYRPDVAVPRCSNCRQELPSSGPA